MANKLKNWLKNRQRDRRGPEIEYLVPDMLQYVKDNYEPLVQYCVVPEIKYSLSSSDIQGLKDPSQPREKIKHSLPSIDISELIAPSPSTEKKPVIEDMKAFKQEAEKNMAMYDSPAMENTYHAWEKKNSEQKSFSSEVVRMVNERYPKTSDFYKAAGIDKRVYHKLSSDYGYKPSRMTAFRCCIGLKLNAEEAEKLLKLAGMAFSPNDPDDLVLKFCLANGINDIPGINYMLYRYANRPLTDR